MNKMHHIVIEISLVFGMCVQQWYQSKLILAFLNSFESLVLWPSLGASLCKSRSASLLI